MGARNMAVKQNKSEVVPMLMGNKLDDGFGAKMASAHCNNIMKFKRDK